MKGALLVVMLIAASFAYYEDVSIESLSEMYDMDIEDMEAEYEYELEQIDTKSRDYTKGRRALEKKKQACDDSRREGEEIVRAMGQRARNTVRNIPHLLDKAIYHN